MLTPVEMVGHHNPYRYYARLVAERPFHFDQNLRMWVASGAEVVSAVLGDPACRVRPHRTVVDALDRADPDQTATLAADHARASLTGAPAPPFEELMFAVPARVLAALSAVDRDAAAAEAAGLVGDDATAGLIGNTVVALARFGTPDGPGALEQFVREVVRYDAPIQNTRRFAAEAVRHGGAEVTAGQPILLLLAAANRDPAANPDPDAFRPDRTGATVFTFGAGAHRCPGERLAVAIATAVVGELLAAGYDPATLPAQVAYRPSPNARIPILSGGAG